MVAEMDEREQGWVNRFNRCFNRIGSRGCLAIGSLPTALVFMATCPGLERGQNPVTLFGRNGFTGGNGPGTCVSIEWNEEIKLGSFGDFDRHFEFVPGFTVGEFTVIDSQTQSHFATATAFPLNNPAQVQ